jgi:hypothetical protein
MAFVLFSPFAEPAYRLDLFTIGTHLDDGKAALSRKELRKAAAEIKDEQGLANINKRSDDCTRGISQVTQANMEMRNKEIRIQEQEMSNNEREGIMLNLHIQLNSLNRVLERAEVRASNCTTNFDSNHYLWQKVIQIENEIDDINTKMKYIMEKTTAGECPPKRARIDDSTTFREGDNMTVATGKSNRTKTTTTSSIRTPIEIDLDVPTFSPKIGSVINCDNADSTSTGNGNGENGSNDSEDMSVINTVVV